ncbi:MAG: hypothetical protein NTZ46_11710 [Verrucomicrobia bacterium]|nr:hypothetical protein [Verrucomicrobiota bacterium]
MNKLRRRAAGFLLLETMIGVLVFAIGVLALARCVEQCINVESAKAWDERARVALENRMAEVEAGAVFFDTKKEEKLKGMFDGITLVQSRVPLRLMDENKKELAGLFEIQLEALWRESGGKQSKVLTFYVFQKR